MSAFVPGWRILFLTRTLDARADAELATLRGVAAASLLERAPRIAA